MNVRIDLNSVTPAKHIKGEDARETRELKQLLREASEYLTQFRWCTRILESYLGIGIGRVLGVFLFRIAPASKMVDEWVWIIVGDLPPAYITAERAPNPACALDGYIGAMCAWVQAVKEGKPTAHLIPVNVVPTIENAIQLESRLNFLRDNVLTYFKEDLEE